MKRLWSALCLLGVLSAATLCHSIYLDHLTSHLRETLTQASQCVEEGRWEEAGQWRERAQEDWQGKSLYLHVTLRHDTVDGVIVSFRDLELLCQQEDREGYELISSRLLSTLELLGSAERFSLENIL